VLTNTGRPDDHDRLVVIDEVGVCQTEDLSPVESPRPAEVYVFYGGLGLELRQLQVAVHAAVVALGELAVDQQPEALVKAQALVVRMAPLFSETLCHCL
jgi:hypothetical protein